MADAPLLTINTDGGSRGNPGEASFGYVVKQANGQVIENGGRLGILTNNQAEYTALVKALRHAEKLGTHHQLLIQADSELMIKQMKGEFKVKNPDLRDLYEEASDLVEKFPRVTFTHVRRESNKRADQLCNEALDGVREELDLDSVAPLKLLSPSTNNTHQDEKLLPKNRFVAQNSLDADIVACLSETLATPLAQTLWTRMREILKAHAVDLPND